MKDWPGVADLKHKKPQKRRSKEHIYRMHNPVLRRVYRHPWFTNLLIQNGVAHFQHTTTAFTTLFLAKSVQLSNGHQQDTAAHLRWPCLIAHFIIRTRAERNFQKLSMLIEIIFCLHKILYCAVFFLCFLTFWNW